MHNPDKRSIPFYLIFCLFLWLLIGTLLSVELIISVMKTLPFLRVSSGFLLTVSLWLVFAFLFLIKFLKVARHLFVMGLWLLTVLSAPGVYLLIQFLERQGFNFSTGGMLYLLVYLIMVVVVVYSSMALTRGGLSSRQIVIARAPMLFVSTMSFVLISVMTIFYVPIPAQQCGEESFYRYKLGVFACDLVPKEVNGVTKITGCYKPIVTFDQDRLAYFRLTPIEDVRCNR